MPETATSLGAAFAEAVTAKDYARIAELLHPEVDFKGLTPNRLWEAGDPATTDEPAPTDSTHADDGRFTSSVSTAPETTEAATTQGI